MKVVALYALTALVTGLHNLYLLMTVINGAPINPLNCAALLGSVTLLAGAGLAAFRRRIAAVFAVLGLVLLWVFYAPLIIVSFVMPSSTWIEIRELAYFQEYVPLVGMLVGPALLIACTLVSILQFRRKDALVGS